MSPDDCKICGVTFEHCQAAKVKFICCPDCDHRKREYESTEVKRDDPPKTLVEFRDGAPAHYPAHKAMTVWINGTEVLVEKNSLSLDFGDESATTVTLTLLPHEVRFNR